GEARRHRERAVAPCEPRVHRIPDLAEARLEAQPAVLRQALEALPREALPHGRGERRVGAALGQLLAARRPHAIREVEALLQDAVLGVLARVARRRAVLPGHPAQELFNGLVERFPLPVRQVVLLPAEAGEAAALG